MEAAPRSDLIRSRLSSQQTRGRLQDLVPIRHGGMLQSPFAFYRGTTAIMAADLAHTPSRVQACGDAHLSNFGAFATPERSLIFDVNDLDETLPAPWEWDVKRLAASVVLAGRHIQLTQRETARAARAAVRSYRTHGGVCRTKAARQRLVPAIAFTRPPADLTFAWALTLHCGTEKERRHAALVSFLQGARNIRQRDKGLMKDAATA